MKITCPIDGSHQTFYYTQNVHVDSSGKTVGDEWVYDAYEPAPVPTYRCWNCGNAAKVDE